MAALILTKKWLSMQLSLNSLNANPTDTVLSAPKYLETSQHAYIRVFQVHQNIVLHHLWGRKVNLLFALGMLRKSYSS